MSETCQPIGPSALNVIGLERGTAQLSATRPARNIIQNVLHVLEGHAGRDTCRYCTPSDIQMFNEIPTDPSLSQVD